jgi:hypothetical protein
MPDKKKAKKVNPKTEVAILRDGVNVLKQRVDLLFTACDEGLVNVYTNEKDPVRMLEKSLEQVERLKSRASSMIQSFRRPADA